MARIRTIKPSFFESEDVAVLPLRARLLWIGLWTHCDDEGRTKDNVKLIKARIWPLDQVTLKDIEEDLEILHRHGRIVRYTVDGQQYLEITNWREHQSINKPTPSKIPPPPKVRPDSRRTPVVVPDDSLQERKGKEGKGGDAHARETPTPATNRTGSEPPSPKCDQHLDDPDPPNCGRCGDARRARDAWEKTQAQLAAKARQADAHQRAEAARLEIKQCRRCDSTGKVDGRTCLHDNEIANRISRGAALAAAAIKRPERGPSRDRPGPVDVARRHGTSLDQLDQALAQVIPLHAATEVSDVEAG